METMPLDMKAMPAVRLQSPDEFYIHGLAALTLLLAEVLSTTAVGHFVEPVAETLRSTYLAVAQGSGASPSETSAVPTRQESMERSDGIL
jgi:hypothetical protein